MNNTYIYTYFLTSLICMACGITFIIQLSEDFGTKEEALTFRKFIRAYMMFVSTNACCLITNRYGFAIPGYFFSSINLVTIYTCAYYWFIYIEIKTGYEHKKNKREKLVSKVPVVVMSVLSLTTYFTHLIFYYAEDGVYTRGPMYLLIFLLATGYIIVASVHLIKKYNAEDSESKRKELLALRAFILFPVLAGMGDFFIPHLPFMELSILFGIVLVYTTTQKEQIYKDALTGLNNRRATDEHLRKMIASASSEKPVWFFLFDVNYFKQINDAYGHHEGDEVLKYIANVLKDTAKDLGGFVSRWGGDEFTLITTQAKGFRPEEIGDIINGKLSDRVVKIESPYQISLSCGYTICQNTNESAKSVLKQADAMLYYQKVKHHREINPTEKRGE